MTKFSQRVSPELEKELQSEGAKADLAYRYEEFSNGVPDKYKAQGYSQYEDFPIIYNTSSGLQVLLLYNKNSGKVEFMIAGTNEMIKDGLDNWFPPGGGKQGEEIIQIFSPIYYSAIGQNKEINLYGDSGAVFLMDKIERNFPGVNTFGTNSGSDNGGIVGAIAFYLDPKKYAYSNRYAENRDYGFQTSDTTHRLLINYGEPVSRLTLPREDRQVFWKISPDAEGVIKLQKKGMNPVLSSLFGGGIDLHMDRSGNENSLLSSGPILDQEPEIKDFSEEMSISIDLGGNKSYLGETIISNTNVDNSFNEKIEGITVYYDDIDRSWGVFKYIQNGKQYVEFFDKNNPLDLELYKSIMENHSIWRNYEEEKENGELYKEDLLGGD